MRVFDSIEVNSHIDANSVFLCCASFESRCLSAATCIDKTKIIKSFVFQYDEFACHTNDHANRLLEILGCGQTVMLSNSDPIRLADTLIDVFNLVSNDYSGCNVVIDITTFTREGLLLIVRLVKSKLSDFNVQFVYNSASEMSNELSVGPRSFRSVLGYSGLLSPSKQNHLIIIFGYEVDRARALIENYEPDLISIGTGSKLCSIKPELHQRNVKFFDQLAAYYSECLNRFEVSIVDPYETCSGIESYLGSMENNMYNTIISPMNTKISTVGVGLFALKNSNVQICYSEMSSYNFTNFSSPSNKFYLFSLSGSGAA